MCLRAGNRHPSGVYGRQWNMHFDLLCAGRQFKVGSALIFANPHHGERAGQPVRPNPLADVRILHLFF